MLYVPANMGIGKLIWTIEGRTKQLISTVGLKSLAGGANLDPEDAADQLGAAWAYYWTASTMRDGMNFIGTEVVQGNGTEEPIHKGVHMISGSGIEGTGSWGALPLNCALLVQKQTGMIGRKHRGRMYLPSGYLSETEIDSWGNIGSTALSSFTTRLNGFKSYLNTEQYAVVLFHPVTEPVPMYPDDVTTLTPADVVATQRRRLR